MSESNTSKLARALSALVTGVAGDVFIYRTQAGVLSLATLGAGVQLIDGVLTATGGGTSTFWSDTYWSNSFWSTAA